MALNKIQKLSLMVGVIIFALILFYSIFKEYPVSTIKYILAFLIRKLINIKFKKKYIIIKFKLLI